ncbi:response regulator [candidate division WWE3 bacterium]|uniref:Response regulator n=1 Tax=candidate division WWE3 bacterium TaxID=2053526 RepID=A0A955RQA8_UNCKA|nr:response regulator [candidate division WWE3 bacterium]
MEEKSLPKILLVEDEASLKELYRELLFSEGYMVDVADDGQMAYEKMKEGGYDLVLLDIRLPKMDGLQILEKLTPEEKSSNKKIIMLTNFSNEQVIKQAYELGASGYLMKSALNPDDVLHEVEAFLSK